jgi:hypothetical protein
MTDVPRPCALVISYHEKFISRRWDLSFGATVSQGPSSATGVSARLLTECLVLIRAPPTSFWRTFWALRLFGDPSLVAKSPALPCGDLRKPTDRARNFDLANGI